MGSLGREWNRGNSGGWNMRYTNGETEYLRAASLGAGTVGGVSGT